MKKERLKWIRFFRYCYENIGYARMPLLHLAGSTSAAAGAPSGAYSAAAVGRQFIGLIAGCLVGSKLDIQRRRAVST